MFHELSAATADKVVLPGVLGPRTLRRTVKYASGPSPCDDPVALPSLRSRDNNSSNMRAGQIPFGHLANSGDLTRDFSRLFYLQPIDI